MAINIIFYGGAYLNLLLACVADNDYICNA